ncbi:hypothetical protein HK100_007230 [Physocladia obscura]|uniref:Galactosylgalactosylxylosylprotein 3-beta-glucuronosyltransferase n=1 Tax=Physocladia obscura TaxID=109957 RepID=A0AAD5TB12_9FUNG|nr:hypothetical protein HK100_007230 [Physocladia obscura]
MILTTTRRQALTALGLVTVFIICLQLLAHVAPSSSRRTWANLDEIEVDEDPTRIYRTSKVFSESFEHALDDIPPHQDPLPSSPNSNRINSSKNSKPWIFFVTPTYKRKDQLVDMTRLSQTLSHDKRIYWIVVEDREMPSMRIRWILERSGLPFAHITTLTPEGVHARGVEQRNSALQIIERRKLNGIVYFGDDDNAYDIRMFRELRKTTGVAVFGVGFAVGHYERCVVDEETGKVARFATNWVGGRMYAIDMAGFATHSSLIIEKQPRFRNDWGVGQLETRFIGQLVGNLTDLQPLMENCTRIYVWHVKTQGGRQDEVKNDKEWKRLSSLV